MLMWAEWQLLWKCPKTTQFSFIGARLLSLLNVEPHCWCFTWMEGGLFPPSNSRAPHHPRMPSTKCRACWERHFSLVVSRRDKQEAARISYEIIRMLPWVEHNHPNCWRCALKGGDVPMFNVCTFCTLKYQQGLLSVTPWTLDLRT